MPRERIPTTEDFSVNVQITIHPSSSGYTAFISAEESQWYRFPIELTQDELKAINSELQQAIEDVSGCFDEIDGPDDRDALACLASKGKFAFNKIFQKGLPREIISSALKASATIQFVSESFFIPWELLYDSPLGAEVDVSYFWGMRHIVSRRLIRNARPGDLEARPKFQAKRPRVGLIAYTGLDYIAEQEIPMLQKLKKNKQIYLSPLDPMDSDDLRQHDKGLKDLRDFLRKNMQIAHLACHARPNEKRIFESDLLVSNEFPITIEDFVREDFEIESKPLVILNACLTGMISPLHTCNWVNEFIRCRARGVLATEFHVPDSFAAAFIKELYDNFLSGISIGEALTKTRLLFWKEHRNPLGLAYALYSSPSIRITS